MASFPTSTFCIIVPLISLMFFITLPSTSGTSSGYSRPPSAKSMPNIPSGQSVSCPIDALKLGVCVDLLGSLVNVTVGHPAVEPCCSLISGLVDLEAAVCLCTAINANILGLNISVPVSLSLLLNVCSKNVPTGFQCG